MTALLSIVALTALGGLLSALAASLFLVLNDARRAQILPRLVSFATGTLLGAALLGLLPHALAGTGPAGTHAIGLTVLSGILLFFVLEKFVLWRHCHDDPCEMHSPSHDATYVTAWIVPLGVSFQMRQRLAEARASVSRERLM